MKRPAIYLFAISLFTCSYTQAQDISFGIKGGVSIPNLTATGNNQTP